MLEETASSDVMETAVSDTDTTQIDNSTEETEVETDETVDTSESDETGTTEDTAATERPKYSELKNFKKTWEPKIQEWEERTPLYEAAQAIGPVQVVQELSKLATPPEFASEEEFAPYVRQALDTVLTAFPHLNGRIQPALAWDYLQNEADQLTIVQSFFGEKATPAKLAELWDAYDKGIIDDELLTYEPDPQVVEANKKAEAANSRIAQIEAQQAERETEDLRGVWQEGIADINKSVGMPVDELITEFKLAPLPGDKPEIKAMKESIVKQFRVLVADEANADQVTKQKWETMHKRINTVYQTPVWQHASHTQRRQMVQQHTKAAGDMYASELSQRVRAIAAPLAKDAADRIAWKMDQLGSKAKEAPVEAGSVTTGAPGGKQKGPVPDFDKDPEGWRRYLGYQ